MARWPGRRASAIEIALKDLADALRMIAGRVADFNAVGAAREGLEPED